MIAARVIVHLCTCARKTQGVPFRPAPFMPLRLTTGSTYQFGAVRSDHTSACLLGQKTRWTVSRFVPRPSHGDVHYLKPNHSAAPSRVVRTSEAPENPPVRVFNFGARPNGLNRERRKRKMKIEISR